MSLTEASEQTVHLIGVGDLPGIPAGELKPGDRLMWNFGHVYEVIAVLDASLKFVAITERAVNGEGSEWPRRLRKDRLVARIAQAGPAPVPEEPPGEFTIGAGEDTHCAGCGYFLPAGAPAWPGPSGETLCCDCIVPVGAA